MPLMRHVAMGIVYTGAASTLISEATARSLLGTGYELLVSQEVTKDFKTAADSICKDYFIPHIEIICQTLVHPLDVYVLPSLPCPILLGLDFLATFELV